MSTESATSKSRSIKLRTLVLLGILLASCVRQRASQVPLVPIGAVGSLVVVIADARGTPLAGANAYLAEDLRVTSDVIMYGKAGAWADERGVARLGAWRPGKYTLVVRIIGFDPETREITLSAGRADTVRIELRPSTMFLQTQLSTPPQTQSRIYLDGPPHMRIRPLGERLAIQFNDEPAIIHVSDGRGGPPITYHGKALTEDRVKARYLIGAKEARERFGDQTLAGAILIELK